MKYGLILALSAVALWGPGTALAEDDSWKFTALFPMIWAPDVRGTITAGEDKIDVDIPFADKIEDLDLGIIGDFFLEKGRFVGGLRLNYLRNKKEESFDGISLPGGPVLISPHEIETITEEGTYDLIIGYHLNDNLTVYGGGRRFGQTMEYKVRQIGDQGQGINGDFKVVDEEFNDLIMGLSWQRPLSKRWSLILSGDTRVAGDSEKDFLVEARIGYRFSELNNVWFGYRGSRIETVTEDGGVSIESDFEQHGPTIGWAFTF